MINFIVIFLQKKVFLKNMLQNEYFYFYQIIKIFPPKYS